VGVNVEPLGEEFGPSVLPDGLAVLFGLVTAPLAPELPVVVPLIEEPVVVPLAAEPPAVELPPAEPPEEPPLCASANVLESAKAVASAIVVSFIVVSLISDGWITAANDQSFRKKQAFRDKRLLISTGSHLAEAPSTSSLRKQGPMTPGGCCVAALGSTGTLAPSANIDGTAYGSLRSQGRRWTRRHLTE
jgi:hypothetical protein